MLIISLCAAAAIIGTVCKIPWVVSIPDDSFQFGIITICAVLAGFHSMNYSMLCSFLETTIAQKLSGTDVLLKREKIITNGIVVSVISIICGVILIFLPGEKATVSYISTFLYYAEILYLILSSIYFVMSFYSLRQLIVIPKLKMINGKSYSSDTLKNLKNHFKNNLS